MAATLEQERAARGVMAGALCVSLLAFFASVALYVERARDLRGRES